MNLRELMTERILFAATEEDLMAEFDLTLEDLNNLSDLDFLEVFEVVCSWRC